MLYSFSNAFLVMGEDSDRALSGRSGGFEEIVEACVRGANRILVDKAIRVLVDKIIRVLVIKLYEF